MAEIALEITITTDEPSHFVLKRNSDGKWSGEHSDPFDPPEKLDDARCVEILSKLVMRHDPPDGKFISSHSKRAALLNPRSCWNKAKLDMPVFTLLPTDALAPDTIRNWASRLATARAAITAASQAKALDALDAAAAMERYAAANGGSGVPGT